MQAIYYIQRSFGNDGWGVWKRTRTGNRRVASNCSEAYARRIAKHLNDDEILVRLATVTHWKDDNDVG